jgi:hypothetical protein
MATIIIKLFEPELATIRTENHHDDDTTAPFTTSPLDTHRGGQNSTIIIRDVSKKKNKKAAKCFRFL